MTKPEPNLAGFAVFTAEPDAEQPLLLISMAEDVKERHGSTYVVEKDKPCWKHI